ncbi:hypothetical protein L484_012180 [Morus notabilis]|uniref:Uncharacterized protein n=1 Tax=Morus notabilis TaxID=981085 RepID=W9R8J6_9ROSA|nr:hypothetical protein L484_012180 [Morus notabilis]
MKRTWGGGGRNGETPGGIEAEEGTGVAEIAAEEDGMATRPESKSEARRGKEERSEGGERSEAREGLCRHWRRDEGAWFGCGRGNGNENGNSG